MSIRITKKNLSSNILLFFFFCATAFPQNQFMELKWKNVGFNYAPGKADVICKDIDNDGRQEIVLDFNNGQYFTVMKYIDNDYQFSWTSPLYQDDNITSIKVYDINKDSNNEICVLHSSGRIDVFDAVTMIKDTTLNTSINNSATLNIGDIDKDGTVEFIIGQINSGSYASVYVLNSQTLEQEWSLSNISIDSWDIEIGNVDGDPADEIVISNGLVIDGASHKADWNYVQGFGTKIALGDIDGDNVKEIISFSNYFDINAFDAQNKTQLWSIKSSEDLRALYVTDIDNDGYAEILVGNNQWGSIDCYSSITKKKIWTVANPNTGTINITLGDPDNDGKKEVIWTAGEGSSGADFLYVANIDQGNLEWQSPNLDGPFSIDVHDINNDGFKEICGTCFTSDNNYGPGRVFIYNPINYKPEWIIGNEGYDYWSFTAVKAGNINDTGPGEIVASSGSWLYVFEAESHKLIWSGQAAAHGTIKSLQISDIDNDGDAELLVGDENGYLYILNGKTFQEEWHSNQFNGSIEKIILTNWDGDEAKEIALVRYRDGITVLDGITHNIEWQTTTLSNMTTCDICDLNRDGKKEFIIGTLNGQIMIVDSLSRSVSDTLLNVGESIAGLRVENLDMDPSPEIIVGTTKLSVFNSSDMSKVYESEYLGSSTGFGDNLIITDVENDRHMDIFASNNSGMFHFRCRDAYPDITPPTIVRTYPKQNASEVTTNAVVNITFSENINEATLTTDNIKVSANDTLEIPFSFKYSADTRNIKIIADTLLPGNSSN